MATIKIFRLGEATRTSIQCGFSEYIFKTLKIRCHVFIKFFGVVLALSFLAGYLALSSFKSSSPKSINLNMRYLLIIPSKGVCINEKSGNF